jgi:hypothetical protein
MVSPSDLNLRASRRALLSRTGYKLVFGTISQPYPYPRCHTPDFKCQSMITGNFTSGKGGIDFARIQASCWTVLVYK